MKNASSQITRPANLLAVAAVAFSVFGFVGTIHAAEPAFDGGKSTWHDGFVRYDFVMEDETLAITAFTRPEKEGFAVGSPAKGQRRCIVVVPNKPARGNPWSWHGCYWDHQPQAETELLHRGFHIAFITPDPGRQWDAWYAYLTEKQGLSKKPAFLGMSKGGVNEYTWAIQNLDKVSCISGENPAMRTIMSGNQPPLNDAKKRLVDNLAPLAKAGVPILHVCGSLDPWLDRDTRVVEKKYEELGGNFTVLIRQGEGHFATGPQDPKPVVDFIVGKPN